MLLFSLVFPKKNKNSVVDHGPKKITVIGPPASRCGRHPCDSLPC